MKEYNYGKKIYYCDHADRIDDMGKLSIDHLPKTSPEWCPVRKRDNPVALYKRKFVKIQIQENLIINKSIVCICTENPI